MRLLDRYIRNTVISATFVVLLALAGIQSFMELVSQLTNIGKGHFTLWSVLITVPLRLPSDLYIFFPVAGFLGCLLGMGRLASTSQLIVMRSSGVSISRISWSVIKASLILIVFMTLIGEWIGPILQNQADHIQQMALGHQDDKRTRDIWLHQKNRFVHIDAVSSASEMKGVSVFKFDSQGQLLSATHAPLAFKKNKQWYLEDSKKTLFSSTALRVEKSASVALPIVFDAELVLNSHDNIQGDSIKELVKDIAYREHSGLLANQYELSFWQRILQPFTTVVMIALGIPFIFGSLRSSSVGLRMLVGVIIGFAFYMLNRLFGPITIVYQFPPLLAALTPTMLFLLAYGILIRRIE